MIKDIKKYIVKEDSTIVEVMKVIQNGSAQIALVVKGNKLLGTISDGDIRRNILKNGSLESNAKDLMRKDFKYIIEGENKFNALRKIKKETLYYPNELISNWSVWQTR